MADQEERERESRESGETRFDDAVEEERQERERVAEELEREGPLEPEGSS